MTLPRTTNYHTPFSLNDPGTPETFNRRVEEVDAEVTSVNTKLGGDPAGGYTNVETRFGAIDNAGTNVQTKANGAQVNPSSILVDASAGFTVGATIGFYVNGTTYQERTIDDLPDGTHIAVTVAVDGTIADDAIISEVPLSMVVAAGAVNHDGDITLRNAIYYAAGAATYHPLAHGAVGDGVTDDRAALHTLVNTTMSNGGVVRIDRLYSVQSALTVPAGVTLQFDTGGRLVVPTGVTVMINGQVDAGLQQIFQCAGTGAVTLGNGASPVLRPEWWGAVAGDDSVDSAAALRAALQAAIGKSAALELSGTYYIQTAITISGITCRNLTVRGTGAKTAESAGIKVANSVAEGSPLAHMISLSDGGTPAWVLQMHWSQLTLDANNRALKIMTCPDAPGLIDTKWDNVNFWGIRYNGIGLDNPAYEVEVTHCRFVGYGTVSEEGTWEGIGINWASDGVNGASNAVRIHDNRFARLSYGLVFPAVVTDVVIAENNFDNIKCCAILGVHGATKLDIVHNYFESCGGVDISVPVQGSDPQDVQAAIILAQEGTGSWTLLARKVNIRDNIFNNVSTTSAIALSGVTGCEISGNVYGRGASSTNFVMLFGHGSMYSTGYGVSGRALYIHDNNLFKYDAVAGIIPAVSKILAWSFPLAADAARRLQGIQIEDALERVHPNQYRNLIPWWVTDKVWHAAAPATVASAGLVEGAWHEYTFVMESGTSGASSWNSVLADVTPWRGKYLRVSYECKLGTSGTVPIMTISDGIVVSPNLSPASSTDTTNWQHCEMLIYVSTNATILRMYLYNGGGDPVGKTVYLRRLQIAPAWLPPWEYEEPRGLVLKDTTAKRPILHSTDAGYRYLDTTLDADGLPILWNGSKWIKYDGTDA